MSVVQVRGAMAMLGLLLAGGCMLFERSASSSVAGPPRKVSVHFFLAASEPQEGYRRTEDEQGRPLYLGTTPVVTERDVERASVWRSERRCMILLEFTPLAAVGLERATAEHIGGRLAVFVDDRLVAAPTIHKPLVQGKVYLDGDFSQARAEEIVRRLTAANR